MWDENPCLIEDPVPGTPDDALTPLVLVHDGGGTVFNYHCIDPLLGRRVIGIANPNFHTGRSWLPGGIPEMARHYVRLLRGAFEESDGAGAAAAKRGRRIILGGWSLGGLVALEMAKVLRGDRALRVVGLVMIDSVCPLTWVQPSGGRNMPTIQAVASQHVFTPTTKQETKDKVTRCFADASEMVSKWEMPAWEDHSPPPPAILLRAVDPVPMEGDGVARVDLARSDKSLQWDRYRKDWLVRVVDIPGHHFNVFSFKNVEYLSTAVREACETLERMPLP
ncbi:hypothetical protein MCOR25_006534 [Pyricularia grisea]|uniref:AB hydrolase-1 domain-containing protein n=1 Tax=Pyricularia grisea TaxID=148305 RepID=A0A6P8B4C8_PYRGI|nr:hypothetical protein PgNI_06477 [Pyricularia grisea]KAI6361163.1 hypothetical protein MCOR25_006534 [Pyricularia grisea]TLD10133.1 hypothetical protein PgNI_06477 [Pyricularia grisea]